MHRAGVVPNHHVTKLPLVPVDKLRLSRPIPQACQQSPALSQFHVLDMGSCGTNDQRFASGTMLPYQRQRLGRVSLPSHYDGNMKITVDIPESDLADAMRFTRAKTKREAIVAAIQDFNRRRRMAELVKHAGTCEDMMTVEELQKQRRRS